MSCQILLVLVSQEELRKRRGRVMEASRRSHGGVVVAACQMLLVLVSQEELFIPAASAPSVSSTHPRDECQSHPLNCSFSSGIAVQFASLTTLKNKCGFSRVHTGTYAISPKVFSHPSRSLVFHHFHAHKIKHLGSRLLLQRS